MFKRLEARLEKLNDLIGAETLLPRHYHIVSEGWHSANVRNWPVMEYKPEQSKPCAWCGGLPPRCCHSEKW